jgi:uncharacterized RDD family membrane protein YckC
MSIDSVPIIAKEETVEEPVGKLHPISGFWRRLAAFIIDILLLGLVGQIIGWSLSSWLFRIGPYGRFIGWSILLIYFGLFNSVTGKGQTFGKRLLKIAVRDSEGSPIGLGRSFLRAFILTLPNMLNGWQLPIFQSIPTLAWIQVIIILSVGGVLIYTMVFNRGTRQGFHDLVCKTFVVHLPGEHIEAFPKVSRIHWIVSAVLICLSLVLVIVGNIVGTNLRSSSVLGIELAPLQGLHETYSSDNRFFTVSVVDEATYSTQRSPVRVLTIEAWYKGRPSSDEQDELMASLARLALTSYESIDEVDRISITILSAYDIGIATGNISFETIGNVETWQERLNQP